MPQIAINDIEMHYETAGDGPPLMLIAGLASDGASWAPIVPDLAKKYRLILPDNRAAGRMQKVDGPVSIAQMADDCAALLNALQIERAHILGHSMGGLVAADLAGRFPDRVDHLIVACSKAHHNARDLALVENLVRLREVGTAEELWFRTFFHWLFVPGFFDDPRAVELAVEMSMDYPYRQSVGCMRLQVDALAGHQSGDPARLKMPVFAIAAELDLMFSPTAIADSLKDVPNLTIAEIPEAGHSVHWDQPKEFIDRLTAFLPH